MIIEVLDDGGALATAAASHIATCVRAHVRDNADRPFALAVSGGSTPKAMLRKLATEDLPWDRIEIFQVDERVAPAGDDDRNLTHLEESLAALAPNLPIIRPMPVEDADLEAAAARYAAELPQRIDLVHLGMGDDGHTASLIPGDAVLDVVDRDVALTDEYKGRRRMTLTYPALDRAAEVLWLIAGADKAPMLARLRDGDPSIPAGRVHTALQVVLADRAAAGN